MGHATYERVTSHVTCKWVVSRVNNLCHICMRHGPDCAVASSPMSRIWMSHATYKRVMSRASESCNVYTTCVPFTWDTDLIAPLPHHSFHTYEWVMSRINESCHVPVSHETCKQLVSHLHEAQPWSRHCLITRVTHMTKLCHTYE